jgi:hypothetical protein
MNTGRGYQNGLSELHYRRLMTLGSGGVLITPRRSEWMPMLRRGFVYTAQPAEETGLDVNGFFLPPIRITEAGYRALAEYVARNGLPEYEPYMEVVA